MQTREKIYKKYGVLSAVYWQFNRKLLVFQTAVFNFSMKFVSKRTPLAERKFTSEAIESAIVRIKKQIANPELAWLFENCFPNTLDTTIDFVLSLKPEDAFLNYRRY